MKTLIVLFFLAAAGTANAENTNLYALLATNAPSPGLSAKLKAEKCGDAEFQRAYITTSATKFAFLIPQAYSLREFQGSALTLQHRVITASISVKLKPAVDCASSECFAETCRSEVLSDFPNTKIVEEYNDAVNGQPSRVFELNYLLANVEPYRVRSVFMKIRGGLLEIALSCRTEDFKATQYELNMLLLTFRESDPTGNLAVTPLSNQY